MLEPFHKWASQRYTASLGNKLKDYGLRYEDLYDPLIDLVRLFELLPRVVILLINDIVQLYSKVTDSKLEDNGLRC